MHPHHSELPVHRIRHTSASTAKFKGCYTTSTAQSMHVCHYRNFTFKPVPDHSAPEDGFDNLDQSSCSLPNHEWQMMGIEPINHMIRNTTSAGSGSQHKQVAFVLCYTDEVNKQDLDVRLTHETTIALVLTGSSKLYYFPNTIVIL